MKTLVLGAIAFALGGSAVAAPPFVQFYSTCLDLQAIGLLISKLLTI